MAQVHPGPPILSGVLSRSEVKREGIEDYELLMEAARHAPDRTDALARMVMPSFTDYLRNVAEFRMFRHELLVLTTKTQR